MLSVELMCPNCRAVWASFRSHRPDDVLSCGSCKFEFEFRQFHALACDRRRAELLLACPDLGRLFDEDPVTPTRRTLARITAERLVSDAEPLKVA